uniref:ATP synthase subunit b n=1 Tax=Acrobeloides nanus TaxID=290746 RepID=A0A914E2A6_9BILA
MSLSRVLAPGRNGPKLAVVTSKRTDIHIPKFYDHDEHKRLEKYQESYLGTSKSGAPTSVGFLGRIVARWRGEPLPGEKEAPEAVFKNVGLDFLPPQPVPRVPADYKENPERDLVNFPFPQRHMFPPKTRLLVLPDSWFQAFYNVTGSSGPYVLMLSLGSFLVNKEFLVWDENIALLIFGWLFYYTLARHAWQPKLDEWAYGRLTNIWEKHKKVIQDDLQSVQNFKKIQAARKDALVTAKENFPAILKENMQLQLEVTYRNNVAKVATELKRRLDYLKETESVKSRLERSIYLHQIIDGVKKQIETNENGIKDAYLDFCIDQLKTLAAKETAKA